MDIIEVLQRREELRLTKTALEEAESALLTQVRDDLSKGLREYSENTLAAHSRFKAAQRLYLDFARLAEHCEETWINESLAKMA